MDPNIAVALNQESFLIFTFIFEFFCCTDANKRNDALESLPPSFEFIPWRRVYKHPAPEAQNTHQLIMEHWKPSELPFRGAGFFWCFTVLHRIGEHISRKTEDDKTWTSKNGRHPKKGYPDEIRVDRLSTTISGGKAFEMLELTLNLEKPSVALCKIWRKNNSQAAASHTGASSTSHQVEMSPIHVELTAEMQIDKHQGQLGGEQQQMRDSELSMSGYVLVNSTQCHQSSTSISELHKGKESFEQLASCSEDKNGELASAPQEMEMEETRPTDTSSYKSYNDVQITGAGNNVANTAEPDPEAMIQQEFTDQERKLIAAEWDFIGDDTDQDPGYSIDNDVINYNYFKSDDFTNPGGGNGANFDSR
ncbi:unnamed protein product [Urochloa humidicola]